MSNGALTLWEAPVSGKGFPRNESKAITAGILLSGTAKDPK